MRHLPSLIAGATIVFLFSLGSAFAQDFPKQPIRLVMPWPAGSITDLSARVLAKGLSARMSTPVIVDNRPGASGQIGATFVAKAPADGYTLVVVTGTHTLSANVSKNLPYDSAQDFIAIAPYAVNPFALVARADFPANTVQEVVEAAKRNPGKYSHASWGIGSLSQLVMELLKADAGIDVVHVPFTGAAPATTALVGGQVDLMILSAGSVPALAGKIKAYAVTTPERFFSLPSTPTMKEQGYPNVNVSSWFGVLAPAKTPDAVVQRLGAEIGAVVKSAEFQTQMRDLGLGLHPAMTPPEFQKFIVSEIARWGEVVRRAKIPLQ
jgi:tripartite-type tricarboxylate transporter receptor subunit TctC